jgi:protein SCO1/2
MKPTVAWIVVLAGATLFAPLARAQYGSPPGTLNRGGSINNEPDELVGVGVDEKIDNQVPADLMFVDETGKTVRLGDYFNRGRPILLQLGYFECPMLCGLVSQGMVESVRSNTLMPGRDYDILYVSIDPREHPTLASLKKRAMVTASEKPAGAGGWHLLTGREYDIKRLTESVGFNYRWHDSQKQFAHAAVLILLTPDGRVSRYLYGVRFDPRTLRLSIVEASEGKVGSIMDQILMTCFQFDKHAGQYTLAAMALLRLAGFFTVLVLIGGLWFAFRHEQRRRRIRRINSDLPDDTAPPGRLWQPGRPEQWN